MYKVTSAGLYYLHSTGTGTTPGKIAGRSMSPINKRVTDKYYIHGFTTVVAL